MVHPHTFPSVLNASAPDWMTTLHLCMQGPDWNMESCYGTTCRQIAGYLCACTQLEGYGASCEWISMLEPWSYQVRNFWARCWSARAWQPFAMLLSLGGEGWKTLSVGHCFQVFWQFTEKHWPNKFHNSRKKHWSKRRQERTTSWTWYCQEYNALCAEHNDIEDMLTNRSLWARDQRWARPISDWGQGTQWPLLLTACGICRAAGKRNKILIFISPLVAFVGIWNQLLPTAALKGWSCRLWHRCAENVIQVVQVDVHEICKTR